MYENTTTEKSLQYISKAMGSYVRVTSENTELLRVTTIYQ